MLITCNDANCTQRVESVVAVDAVARLALDNNDLPRMASVTNASYNDDFLAMLHFAACDDSICTSMTEHQVELNAPAGMSSILRSLRTGDRSCLSRATR